MDKKTRLGRGLDALIGGHEHDTATATEQRQVRVDQIEQNPFQPRKNFDDDELRSLSASIKNHGVLQPLVVRQVGEKFQLVAGERRLRAAQTAGLDAVPVRLVNFNDQEVLEAALVENIQRSDLNPIEKAEGFKDYLDRFKMTHEQLAARLGLARPTITNLVNLLEMPGEVQTAVRVGQLSLGHAKVLKGVGDPERMVALTKEIVTRGLSVHATTDLIKQPTPEPKSEASEPSEAREPREAPEKTAHVQGIEDELRQKLTVRVEIKLKERDKGQIVLGFESNDDFERVVAALRK
jgi:ParB family transcriptional regulator, chromosome partitioning protein